MTGLESQKKKWILLHSMMLEAQTISAKIQLIRMLVAGCLQGAQQSRESDSRKFREVHSRWVRSSVGCSDCILKAKPRKPLADLAGNPRWFFGRDEGEEVERRNEKLSTTRG